ncbi:hypothetical protein NQ318_000403 [Aromia moschata]|uniref:Uncharacterized protein n=1 Tax=Aromia moschata TaxID=1265417 RepID=A0AAV8YU35_9CUCU|nr:hypothetical protein NQ318_000403 [Aromia moschata]
MTYKDMKGLKIQSNLQESILLHRDIAASMQELGHRVSRLDDAQLVKKPATLSEPSWFRWLPW